MADAVVSGATFVLAARGSGFGDVLLAEDEATFVLAARGSGLEVALLDEAVAATFVLAASGSGLGAALLDEVFGATFVVAARGSGFEELLLGNTGVLDEVTLPVEVLAELPDGMFVLADRGEGRTLSVLGALDVPTGSAPTPLVLVLPSGLGCTG